MKESDFIVVKELGTGATGVVSKVKYKETGNDYAMKKIKINRSDSGILKEIMLLRDLNHNNIISLYTSFVEGDHIFLIMECAPRGDMLQHIEKQKKSSRFFPEKALWKFAF